MKWVGGKRQLLPEIRRHTPAEYNRYFEPMVGGGAVFFDINPKNASINDINSNLILAYKTIKDNPKGLVDDLKKHENNEEYFYKIRSLDRDDNYSKLSDVEKVSRILYLNRTCFNGLYRVNRSGYFNVPFGRYKNPNIVNEELIHFISEYLNSINVEITCTDFEKSLSKAKKDDFIYLDPPYDPVSATSSFTSYTELSFDKKEQIRLKNMYDDLSVRGCKVLMSNSATDFIKELYKEYEIVIVKAKRNINSKASKRGVVDEVLVKNY